MFIACFLEDIVRLQKLGNTSPDGPQSFSDARLLNFDEFEGFDVLHFNEKQDD